MRFVTVNSAALAAALLLFGLVGCGSKSASPLRVGLVVWSPFEMAYLARDLGYYEGANIELIDFASPAEFVLAYQNGSIDAVATVLGYALQLQHIDPQQRIVLVIDQSLGGDALVAQGEIATLAELRGKRVGYEASALGAYMLVRALDHAQLTYGDIIPVAVDIQNQAEAFRQRRIDAVVTYEPIVTQLLAAGGRVVFDSAQIPGEIIDVLLTSTTALEGKRRSLQAFVDGWFKALDYYRANPTAAAQRVVARSGLTVEAYLKTFDKVELVDREANQRYLSSASSPLPAALEQQQRIMIREGILPSEVALSGMLDDVLVR